MRENSEKEPLVSNPVAGIKGNVDIPGDKSISHRALIIPSLVIGKTRVSGLLEGDDVLNTAKNLTKLSSLVERKGERQWDISGLGVGGLLEASDVLDFGNSGTGSRLMLGVLATHPFSSFLTGDASLRKRPMERVMKPLRRIGATFVTSMGGKLPMAVTGPDIPMPIEYEMEVASAQVKSAVLLAALNTPGTTTVIEKEPTRDHTERMLKFFGAKIKTEKLGHKSVVITIQGEQELVANHHRAIKIPGDPSSAAFAVVAAIISKNSKITISNICVNPHRIGLFETLKEMGAKIVFKDVRNEGGEPVADVVAESSELKGITVPAERAPSMIDEYPILGVAAAFASGKTTMLGLSELKVKESNRLKGIADGLKACGVEVEVGDDSLVVSGDGKLPKGGGLVKTNMDHRIAMSFLVFGMASREAVAIDDGSFIKTSFPDFIGLMNHAGAEIYKQKIEKDIAKKQYSMPRGKKPFIVAVDGPAASGKGTLGRRIAQTLGLSYLDTGSLYRAVGLKLVYANQDPKNVKYAVEAARSITLNDLINPRLRQERVGKAASVVAAIPEVRYELLQFQRDFAVNSGKGAVLDGRDIGTVVCPDADVKFFVTASIAARAKRRHRELQGQGIEVIFSSVLGDLEERDERDRKRDTAPMQPARDSIILDTTRLTANEVFEKVMETISSRVKG